MHRLIARRLLALVVTTFIALSFGHVMFNAGLDQMSWGAAIADTPAHIIDIVQGDLGYTPGGSCVPKRGRPDFIGLCGSYGKGNIGDVLHARLPVDVQLVVGGLLLGTLLGVLAGRFCAAFPRSRVTRALHVMIAILQSCPPYFLAFMCLIYFSWSAGDYKIPFVSGQGDYRPFSEDPVQFVKALWVPWVCAGLSLAAFVARITEVSVDEALEQDFVLTASAKGLSDKRVVNRHALPVAAPAIAAMTGVNVSTLLINIAAIEYGFGIPGMFSTIRAAILMRDIPVLEALVLEGVILVVIANLLVDVFQVRLDPRIRARAAG